MDFIRKVVYFLLLFSLNQMISQTQVPAGTVSGNWVVGNSPYLIQGHIMVPVDSSLIIEPGVVVIFEGHYKFNVQGNLQAVGTISDSITFIPRDSLVGWWGIRFALTSSSQDSSRIKYCKLQYGWANGAADNGYGGAVYFNGFSKVNLSCSRLDWNYAVQGGAIYCNSASPLIKNNTIADNVASDQFSVGYGGGIYCISSSPLINGNFIARNNANSADGGGIYCDASSPSILNNSISGNTCGNRGGGIFFNNGSTGIISLNIISNNKSTTLGNGVGCYTSSPTISNNTISFNECVFSCCSQSYGGGIGCDYSSSLIENNIIENNSLSFNYGTGAGIYNNHSNLTVRNNTIRNNFSLHQGGGVFSVFSSSTFVNNFICNNESNNGGGVFCSGTQAQTYINNVICNNSAMSSGGGVYAYMDGGSQFNNCTIANNNSNTQDVSVTNGGGGIYCTSNSDLIFNNCIIFTNTALNTNGNQVYLDDDASDPVFKFCDIEGGTSSFYINGNVYLGQYLNNINVNPNFFLPSLGVGSAFDATSANWSLNSTSICINRGNVIISGLLLPAYDIIGTNRIIADTVDIGAYEFNSCVEASIDETVLQTSGMLSAISSGVYQWYDCNLNSTIQGETNQNFQPTYNGSFSVLIAKSGCIDTSLCININDVRVNEGLNLGLFEMYPNPVSNELTIKFPNLNNRAEIKIYSLDGRMLLNFINFKTKSCFFDLSYLSVGVYFVVIETDGGISRQKLIKNN